MSPPRLESNVPGSSGGDHPSMEPPRPNHLLVIPEPEPMDHEERPDSGVNSGSDFHSSSPKSNRIENIPYPMIYPSQTNQLTNDQPYNNFPFHFFQNGHSMLTPTNSIPITYPKSFDGIIPAGTNIKIKREVADQEATPGPSGSTKKDGSQPSCSKENAYYDALLTGLLAFNRPPKHKSFSNDSYKSDNDTDKYDEQGLKAPKVNSNGKVRLHKCKQCDFVTDQKPLFWEHNKSHIGIKKLLTCPKCPFVTEFKQHLTFHLRNHDGSKPFKCSECDYTCVNKSMLKSHMKSHSRVYQFRCADCAYKAKYCHSFKLHLRKHSHKPGIILNADGTPNPYTTIDVYGARRGSKVKYQVQRTVDEVSSQPAAMSPLPLHQIMLAAAQMQYPFPGFPLFPSLPGAMPNPAVIDTPERFVTENGEELSQQMQSKAEDQSKPVEEVRRNRRKGRPFKLITAHKNSSDQSKPNEEIRRSRRKGRPFKLIAAPENPSDDEEETSIFNNVDIAEADAGTPAREKLLEYKRPDMVPNRDATPNSLSNIDVYGTRDGPKVKCQEPKPVKQVSPQPEAMLIAAQTQFPFPGLPFVPGAKANLALIEFRVRLMREMQYMEGEDAGTTAREEGFICRGGDCNNNNANVNYNCQYCKINFEDPIFHNIHMSYHGYNNPFACNMCGVECNNKFGFFLHIAHTHF